MKMKKIEKDEKERSEETQLPDGWKQQGGAEALLHPEGREYQGPIPIGVARPGPTMLGEDKLADNISTQEEKGLIPEGWKEVENHH